MRKRGRIVARHLADEDNAVITTVGSGVAFCAQPCSECPWRVESDGSFPAEAFRISAPTAYDMADRTFGCHTSGVASPRTCAGALLSTGAEHSLVIRLALASGAFHWSAVRSGGARLHHTYRSMAEANGVSSDDPALERCR